MFVREKKVGGNTYYYLVKSQRVDGVPRQKVVKYLGPVKPSKKDLEEIIAGLDN